MWFNKTTVIFSVIILVCGQEKSSRVKRYLALPDNSSFFCWTETSAKKRQIPTEIRMNFKANMLPWSQIFAQAVGFRLNYDDKTVRKPHFRLHRRDLYSGLQLLLDRHGLSGHHCLKKTLCQVNYLKKRAGVYYKVLQLIFRKTESTLDWHSYTPEDCVDSHDICPISILDLMLYTDL